MLKKKTIEKILKREADLLGFEELPKLRFNNFGRIYANNDKFLVSVSLSRLEALSQKDLYNAQLWDFVNVQGFKNRIRFIIAHELAHLYHWRKFKKHYLLFWKKNKQMRLYARKRLSHADYRKVKHEAIADKIGICIAKNYFKKAEA